MTYPRYLRSCAVFSMMTAFTIMVPQGAWAEPGVTADSIRFGQVAALTGAASSLGTEVRRGLSAAFDEANAKGGVKGHKLDLWTQDDGYEPKNTLPLVTKMEEDGKIFALVGGVGTPTTQVILPLLEQKNLLLVGPVTGAESLRDPFNPQIVNVRASYGEETELMVDHLVKDLGAKKIAVFYQDDGFGKAGLGGVKKALEKRNMAIAVEGAFERNTIAVGPALEAIKKATPDAVVVIAPYAPSAVFTKMARKEGLNVPFVNISFVGTAALGVALGADAGNVFVTQVVPSPTETSLPLVARYQAALKKTEPDAKPGFGDLEGYIIGRLVVAALEKTSGELTRDNFKKAFAATGSFDIDGFALNYGANDNRGSHVVFLTKFDGKGKPQVTDSLK